MGRNSISITPKLTPKMQYIDDDAHTVVTVTTRTGVQGDKPKPDVQRTPTERRALMYATHPLLLYFTDPATEQRYFDFQYVENSFIPGKMFALMWVGLAATTFVIYTQPFSNDADYTVESFSSPWWYGVYICTAINSVLWIGLFFDSLRQYREIIHLAQIFTGWPMQILAILYTKRPQAYNYAQLLGCSFFCMVIVQCRLFRSLPFVTLWPLVCMLAVTFGVPDYWDHHTYVEMVYWGIFLLPVLLLLFLELHTRKWFVGKELSTAAITEIEHKTAVTQRMIANFFPATPTRDLLQVLNGPRDKAYQDTVLIVTDVAGFTAYTSRSNPPDVIDMLTDMFRAFDTTACRFGVEKIATVGDSYCGAVFPSTRSNASRCTDGILFACSTLGFAGPGLEQRVGVHIGDIVGVFVGSAPPKFDVFGPGIDHARLMEEVCQPGFVHISTPTLTIVGTQPTINVDVTNFGLMCLSWHQSVNLLNGLDHSDSDDGRCSDYGGGLDAARIVEALCTLSNIEPPVPTAKAVEEGDEAEDDRKSSSSEDQEVPAGGRNHSLVRNNDATPEDPYEFHILFLQFKKGSVERKFQRHIQALGINEFCCKLFLAFTFVLFVVQLNLQCSSRQDMVVSSVLMAIVAFLSCYLQFIGTDHRYHAPVSFVAYNSLFIISFLTFTADCGGLELREKYVGDIAACYLCIAIFAPQYCLDVRLVYRCLMTVSSSLLWIICIVIRRNTVQDEVAQIDPLPLCGLAFVTMSFFPDFSLRSAFRTEMQLRRLQKVAKSRSGAMATSALSIMLPTFVTEKIIHLAQEAKEAVRNQPITVSDTMTTSSGYSQDAAGDIDFNGVAATWEYSHAVVMFAKFHSNDPAFTPEAINMTVMAVEQITQRFEVMKVKTIGSTIMLVAGIDDPRTRQEQLTGIVDAAIMIRACVFQQMNIPNLVHRIGVHCGPCFGAVIGGNGAIFDLFGDTVNTASRMMSSATLGAIQLSSAANALLLPRLRDVVDAREPVSMKGKGVMEVFAVKDDISAEQLPEFVSRDAFSSSMRGPLGILRNSSSEMFSSKSSDVGGRGERVVVTAMDAWRSNWGKDSTTGSPTSQ